MDMTMKVTGTDIAVMLDIPSSEAMLDFINEHWQNEVEVALRNLVQAAQYFGVK